MPVGLDSRVDIKALKACHKSIGYTVLIPAGKKAALR